MAVWKCQPIEAEFNQDQVEDTQDIPIKYMKGDTEVTAFADPKSFKIKNTTKIIPSNSILHASYLVDNVWWCKVSRYITK